LAVAAALASYYLVERPSLRLRRLIERRRDTVDQRGDGEPIVVATTANVRA
jgi:peptidoglycan/LPS O-acetylase OafA/YrhL